MVTSSEFPSLDERTSKAVDEVEAVALPMLTHGRQFDIAHTRAVVHYAGHIAFSEGLDPKLLLTAAWLHDVGYSGLFETQRDSNDYDEVKKAKDAHMEIGAEFALDLLTHSPFASIFSADEVASIARAIQVHDNLEVIKSLEDNNIDRNRFILALAQADSLGMIDPNRAEPTYSKPDLFKFLEKFKQRRVPLFYDRNNQPYFESTIGLLNRQLAVFEAYIGNLPDLPDVPSEV